MFFKLGQHLTISLLNFPLYPCYKTKEHVRGGQLIQGVQNTTRLRIVRNTGDFFLAKRKRLILYDFVQRYNGWPTLTGHFFLISTRVLHSNFSTSFIQMPSMFLRQKVATAGQPTQTKNTVDSLISILYTNIDTNLWNSCHTLWRKLWQIQRVSPYTNQRGNRPSCLFSRTIPMLLKYWPLQLSTYSQKFSRIWLTLKTWGRLITTPMVNLSSQQLTLILSCCGL